MTSMNSMPWEARRDERPERALPSGATFALVTTLT